MDESRYLEYLDDDFRRLRAVVAGALGEPVPGCPGWTGADLAFHLTQVYLHKTETMRLDEFPKPWPPPLGDDPPAALDDAYRRLVAEFDTRKPDEHTPTWYEADQSVGFWVRRMAYETVIHRVDAELAAGLTPGPVPTELAEGGIEEVLTCFLAYGSVAFAEDVADLMAACDGDTVRVDVPGTSWLVQLGPGVVTVIRSEADTDAVVRGEPDPVLRWLWRRVGNSAVELDGNRGVIGKLHGLLGLATQ